MNFTLEGSLIDYEKPIVEAIAEFQKEVGAHF